MTLKQSMREEFEQRFPWFQYVMDIASEEHYNAMRDWWLDQFDHIIEEKIKRLKKEKKVEFDGGMDMWEPGAVEPIIYLTKEEEVYNHALDKAINILKE